MATTLTLKKSEMIPGQFAYATDPNDRRNSIGIDVPINKEGKIDYAYPHSVCVLSTKTDSETGVFADLLKKHDIEIVIS